MLKFGRLGRSVCYLAVWLIALLPVAAQSQAVAGLNAEAGVSGGWLHLQDDFGSSKTLSADVVGRLNIPVYRYLGASVEANAGTVRDKIDFHDPYSAASSIQVRGSLAGVTGSLFLRDPQWGKLGASWSASSERDKFSTEGSQQPDQTQSTHAQWYGANGEVYLADFTVGAAKHWPKSSGEFAPRFPLVMNAAWYGDPNVRATANFQTLSAQRVYGVALAWSPAWIEHRLELAASVATIRSTDDRASGSSNYSLGATVTYFFTPALDLKQRDRAWR